MATAAELRRLREEQSIFAPLYEAARQQQSELAAEGRRPVFGGLLSKEPTYGTDTLRYEGIGNMLAGLLSPAAKAVDAPISAYRGTIPQEDMISEALGVGGLAMAGGGAVGVPRGAVGANALRGDKFFAQDEIDIYTRQARNPKSRETLTYMSPQDFLALAKKTTAGEKTEKTRKLLREGTQFESIPFLSVQNQGGGNAKVVGHEGRNRMMALAEAGVESVPVRLNMTGGGGGPSIRWGEALDPNSFDYVDPKDIPVRVINEDENMVYSMPDSVVSPITQAASPSSDLLPLGGYRKPERKLSKEEQDIEDQISESILFDILRDYDTTAANASKSTGLLTTAASEAQDMAKRILDLRAQGRASEVTDEMMAQADPQYMFANTPLPMDEASRMARAEAAGFDVSNPVFHGGASGIKTMDADVSEGKDFDTGVWTTSDRYNANRYAGSRTEGAPKINDQQNWSIYDDRGSVYPLLAKTSGYGETNFRGRNWGDAPEGAIIRGGGQPSQRISEVREDWRAWPYTSEAVRAARDTGRSGLVIKDVVDIGPNFPHKDHIGLGSEISDDVVAIDPSTLRSRFARFDPEFAHLSNLSAANVSPIGGLLAQSGANQQSGPVAPNLIDEYLKSLQARR